MYENAQYTKALSGELNGIKVQISGLPAWVPLDPANTDYQNIMTLVAEGKLTIAPAEAQ